MKIEKRKKIRFNLYNKTTRQLCDIIHSMFIRNILDIDYCNRWSVRFFDRIHSTLPRDLACKKRDPPGYNQAKMYKNREWDFNQDDIHEREGKLPDVINSLRKIEPFGDWRRVTFDHAVAYVILRRILQGWEQDNNYTEAKDKIR